MVDGVIPMCIFCFFPHTKKDKILPVITPGCISCALKMSYILQPKIPYPKQCMYDILRAPPYIKPGVTHTHGHYIYAISVPNMYFGN